jgi:hypothetical protein
MPDIDRCLLLSCVDNTAPAIVMDGWSNANPSRDTTNPTMRIADNSISCRKNGRASAADWLSFMDRRHRMQIMTG